MAAATPWKEAGVVVAVKLLVGARTLRTGVAREKFEEGRKCKEKGQNRDRRRGTCKRQTNLFTLTYKLFIYT